MGRITLTARWKEELVASSDEGILIFELTMGRLNLYFPSQKRWLTQVPSWAAEKYPDYLAVCEQWCKVNRIPITIVDDAHVYHAKSV